MPDSNRPFYLHNTHSNNNQPPPQPFVTPSTNIEQPQKNPSLTERTRALWKKHWFLFGVAVVVTLAAAYPDLGKKQGYLRAEYTVNYVAVSLIFVLSGISLKTKVLANAVIYWRIHLAIQSLSLGLFPLFAFGVARLLLLAGFETSLAQGIIIACSTPTTIASNVLMTKAAHGNEPAALMNAVIGNIIGVFVSPAMIGMYLGNTTNGVSVDFQVVFRNLTLTVIVPLIVGQLLQFFCPSLVAFLKRHISFPHLSSALLLLLVYSVFCNTFADNVAGNVSIGQLFVVVFVDLALFLTFSALAFAISRIPALKFTKPDTVAIVNCGATKTLALGIPIINVMFNSSPFIGLYSIPLIIYHSEQIIVGFLYVGYFQKWIRGRKGQDDDDDDDDGKSFCTQREEGEADVDSILSSIGGDVVVESQFIEREEATGIEDEMERERRDGGFQA